MKTKENKKKGIKNNCKNNTKNIFYKVEPYGISLIVLVITIIVIIILATIVIVTLLGNNPIEEANKARYENDRDSIQSVFTNTVAKIMAKNESTIEVEEGEINSVKSGVSSTEGQVNYKLNNPMNSSNINGKVIFDIKENGETTYYTGKKLPIYGARETTWYVNKEGIISLRVGEKMITDSENNGNENDLENNNEIDKKLDLLNNKITELEQKNELLQTSIIQLKEGRRTKLIQREFSKAEFKTNKNNWTKLEQIDFHGNDSGKAIISFTASNWESGGACINQIQMQNNYGQILGADSDKSDVSLTYLRSSTTAVIQFDENTVIDLLMYTDQSLIPYYGYSVFIFKDEN